MIWINIEYRRVIFSKLIKFVNENFYLVFFLYDSILLAYFLQFYTYLFQKDEID